MAKHIKKQCIDILKSITVHDTPYRADRLYPYMVDECVRRGIAAKDIVRKDTFYMKWLPKESWLEIYYDPYLKDSYYRRIDDPAAGQEKSRIGQMLDKCADFVMGGRGVCRK